MKWSDHNDHAVNRLSVANQARRIVARLANSIGSANRDGSARKDLPSEAKRRGQVGSDRRGV